MVKCLTYLCLHSSMNRSRAFRFFRLERFGILFTSNYAIYSIWSVSLSSSTSFTHGFLIYWTFHIYCIKVNGALIFLIASSYGFRSWMLIISFILFIPNCLALIYSILSAFSWEILCYHIGSVELSSSSCWPLSHGVKYFRALEIRMLEFRILLASNGRLHLCYRWCFTWRH